MDPTGPAPSSPGPNGTFYANADSIRASFMTPSSAFISYSEPDWRLAWRLRVDLKRASINAWAYQHDGEPGAHFVAEYKAQIENSDLFCLLDSHNARQSDHMKVEAQHALGHGKPIYVCLAEPRLKGGNWWNVELFDDQNLLRAFDLTGDDHQYRAGVQELFFTFGLSYRLPDILLPRTEEFEQEIADLDLRTRRRLLEMCSNFAEVYGSDSRSGIAQLTVLAGYCKGSVFKGYAFLVSGPSDGGVQARAG